MNPKERKEKNKKLIHAEPQRKKREKQKVNTCWLQLDNVITSHQLSHHYILHMQYQSNIIPFNQIIHY